MQSSLERVGILLLFDIFAFEMLFCSACMHLSLSLSLSLFYCLSFSVSLFPVLSCAYARSTEYSVCLEVQKENETHTCERRGDKIGKVNCQARGTINTNCILEWIFRPVSTGSSLPSRLAIRKGRPPDRRRIIYVSLRRTIMSKPAITPTQPNRRSSSFTLSGNIR